MACPCGVSSPKLMGLKIEIHVSTCLTGICFEGCPVGLLTQKKDIALRRCLLVGVPRRTRTVDIQSHKQVVELPITPVSIGISALLRFAFAPILRRIFAEL